MPQLKNPKVKDVIAALQTFDPELPFIVEDADSNWEIHNFTLVEGNGQGDYGCVWLIPPHYGDFGKPVEEAK